MATQAKMTEAEWNKEIDKWFAETQKGIGVLTVPQLGIYPPNPMSDFECVQQHKLVTEDMIRHYANAVGDVNPLYCNPHYAQNTRWGGVIAPPTFECWIAPPYSGWPPVTMSTPECAVSVGGGMSGAEHLYYKTIRPGDEFSCLDRMVENKEFTKPNMGYRLFRHRVERKYINQRGEVACVAYGGSMLAIASPAKAEEMRAKTQATRGRRRYTEEELEVVHNTYDEDLAGKSRCGADMHYWEDVVEGEELTPVVTGPLTVMDSTAFFYGVYSCAFGVKWALMKAAGFGIVDSETGEQRMGGEVHLRDSARDKADAMGFGAHQEGAVAHLLCNWMGDDAFCKRFDAQSRRPWDFGDLNWIKGKVTRKYIDNDEHLVDLELWAENQDGVVQMPVSATVLLVSREDWGSPSQTY